MRELKKRIKRLEKALNPEPSFRPGVVFPESLDGGYRAKGTREERVFATLEEAKGFLRARGCRPIIVVELVSAKREA
ncbi:hypothetical protein [Candidatus Caldatribacterium saccharofermentans]|uniref:hypothetical protein n=1 Tax=Candidatus Caldatribacterium saccharofermentans TaxID=1454753 RepID=UPI003D076410